MPAKDVCLGSGSSMARTTFSIIKRALYPFGFKGFNIERMCPKPALHKGQTHAKPYGPALLQPDEPHTQSNPDNNYINGTLELCL